MQRLRDAEPAFLQHGGEVQLAEKRADDGHDHNGDQRRGPGQKALAVMAQHQHDQDGAAGQQQVDGVAVICRAVAARAVSNARAAQADAQHRHNGAGDVGLKQAQQLLAEDRPDQQRHNAAHQAGAGVGSQAVLGPQGNAGRDEHKAAFQHDRQPRAGRPGAQALQNGGQSGDQQTARDQQRDLGGGQPDPCADQKRHRDHVEHRHDDLLDAEQRGLFRRGTFVKGIAGRDAFHGLLPLSCLRTLSHLSPSKKGAGSLSTVSAFAGCLLLPRGQNRRQGIVLCGPGPQKTKTPHTLAGVYGEKTRLKNPHEFYEHNIPQPQNPVKRNFEISQIIFGAARPS